jgi:hypothetical protein
MSYPLKNNCCSGKYQIKELKRWFGEGRKNSEARRVNQYRLWLWKWMRTPKETRKS